MVRLLIHNLNQRVGSWEKKVRKTEEGLGGKYSETQGLLERIIAHYIIVSWPMIKAIFTSVGELVYGISRLGDFSQRFRLSYLSVFALTWCRVYRPSPLSFLPIIYIHIYIIKHTHVWSAHTKWSGKDQAQGGWFTGRGSSNLLVASERHGINSVHIYTFVYTHIHI